MEQQEGDREDHEIDGFPHEYQILIRRAKFRLRSAEGAKYDSQGQALSEAKRVAPRSEI